MSLPSAMVLQADPASAVAAESADSEELWPGQTSPSTPVDDAAERTPGDSDGPSEPNEAPDPSESADPGEPADPSAPGESTDPTEPAGPPSEETESNEQPGADPPGTAEPGLDAPTGPGAADDPVDPARPPQTTGPQGGGASGTPPSADPSTPAPLQALTAGSVQITGEPRVGEPLRIELTGWDSDGTSFEYQWQRDGAAVQGATAREYTPAPRDRGHRVSAQVTATRAGYATRTVASAVTAVVLPGTLATVAPRISGTAVVGATLAAETEAWEPRTPRLSYRWKRDGRTIPGARGAHYRLAAADAGARITVTVHGAVPGYSPAGRSSAPTETVLRPLSGKGTPRLRGEGHIGEPLTVDTRAWRPTGAALSYQWLRDSTAIPGATRARYTPNEGDAGARIAVTVTATKTGHQRVSAASASRTVPDVLRAAKPRVFGAAVVGSRVSAQRGAWTANCDYRYQWFRGGYPIPGATGVSYRVTGGDTGLPLSVLVTGAQRGYTPESRASGATAPVRELASVRSRGPQRAAG